MLASPTPLHIPDGFLSITVSLLFWVVTIAVLSVAVRRTESVDEKQVPLMGIMAAFIFAAQMINFPVAGGTSGHLLGGALAAIVLGPWAGMLVMTAVIGVQGLLLQDGGLLVMGANLLNMGLLTSAIGFGLYRSTQGRQRKLKLGVAGFAAWLSVMAGALATSLQLWLSGTARLDIVLPAMLGIHAVIGIGETLITVAALAFIFRTRPDLLEQTEGPARGGRGWIVVGALISLAVLILSPLASTDPDGLERVASDLGFLSQGTEAPFKILSNYSFPILGEGALSTIVAGLIGILVVAAIVILITRSRKTQPH
ncbi:MAG: energy-coupling factor ABC transporter permease [Anaerolineales bacterium]|uniref:Energy-coupling factor ABC transporter permease n=1 Tax=Candidatus Desulfolinea nitratireducens TaxID=2841698 RepID=A0A8J6NHT7_9CHLR|nr:energy-coupling factor ABC transporter permease [Candidatus Desulfolinea nitratireducens]